ncbi:MAG: hypothetical protein J7545_00945 [Roseofilum sp. SBFL]|uniref:hypothetical protein n=1 Tax=Roseofilum sp. SBFL TaxID=2821496 RepID=UPI001B1EF298|nr:hypothetical protein [Roseofilum sp. SBFL]MBP0040534.1 hypothetical protein [Roseofilum sp. SBFL]
MTVDEALAIALAMRSIIAETLLDGEGLNDVQQFIFRQCWQGRCSYPQIAEASNYDDEYIKSVAAKLWKQLSGVLDEKVKKGNLQAVFKRYLRRNSIILHRTQEIEVNLNGANLSGATLNLANLSSEAVLHAKTLESELLPENPPETNSYPEAPKYLWNGWHFDCEAQLKIAEALDRANVLFFPNAKARLTTSDGRENKDAHFLVFHQGKWGILEVVSPDRIAKTGETDNPFEPHGISLIHCCDYNQCNEDGDRVVREFLELLTQE